MASPVSPDQLWNLVAHFVGFHNAEAWRILNSTSMRVQIICMESICFLLYCMPCMLSFWESILFETS